MIDPKFESAVEALRAELSTLTVKLVREYGCK